MDYSHSDMDAGLVAAKAVDEKTVESILTMCCGAMDSLHKQISILAEELTPIRRLSEPVDTLRKPDHDCELGMKLSELYSEITRAEQLITTYRLELRLQ
jgi:hypothetical protein